MSPNKTLYVRDEDVSLWERAEKTAQRTRLSVSAVVSAALRAYLPTVEHVLYGDTQAVTRVPLYPEALRVISPEMAQDPNFDPGVPKYTFSPADSTPVLEWTNDGWRLFYLNDKGDVDEHLLVGDEWSTGDAVKEAKRYLDALRRDADEITVDMRDNEGREWTEGFRGRWLMEPGDDNRYGPDGGACYGIASTAKGRIAVYCYHINGRWAPKLVDYESLDAAQADLHLDGVAIAQAAAELGETRVVWRDI